MYGGSRDYMWGFSKKRFFITLGLSIFIWFMGSVYQAFATFGKYIGTFSSGCQVTGYPIDICEVGVINIPSVLVIIFNIAFWFWLIHFFWNIFSRKKF